MGVVKMKKAKSVKKAAVKKKSTPKRKTTTKPKLASRPKVTVKKKSASKSAKSAVKKVKLVKAFKKPIQGKKVQKPATIKPVAIKSKESTTPMTDLILERMRIIDGRKK
jgi:hypothetical protein